MRTATGTTTTVSKAAQVTRTPVSNKEFVPFASFAFFVVVFVVPVSAAVVDPELRVVLRTYDASETSELAPALATAAAILEHAGIAATWVSCDAVFVRRDDDPCLARLGAHELAIRFVRLPPHKMQEDVLALGDSLVDTHLRTGSLATIYVNRVAALARRCRIDAGTLLGRALAHEIGHLLLGTSAHTTSGLMRATWSQHALRNARVDEWVFAPQEAESMRDAVRMRNARRMAAARIGE
jgi:hypothetical protein